MEIILCYLFKYVCYVNIFICYILFVYLRVLKFIDLYMIKFKCFLLGGFRLYCFDRNF